MAKVDKELAMLFYIESIVKPTWAEMAQKFGCSESNIRKIAKRENWIEKRIFYSENQISKKRTIQEIKKSKKDFLDYKKEYALKGAECAQSLRTLLNIRLKPYLQSLEQHLKKNNNQISIDELEAIIPEDTLKNIIKMNEDLTKTERNLYGEVPEMQVNIQQNYTQNNIINQIKLICDDSLLPGGGE